LPKTIIFITSSLKYHLLQARRRGNENQMGYFPSQLVVVLIKPRSLQMETMLRAKGDGEETLSSEQESLLHSELQVAQEELDTMAKLNSRLGYEIKRNELALTNMMKNYDGRKQFAKRLEQDVSSAEGMTASSTPPTMGTGTATTTAITTVPPRPQFPGPEL